MRRIITAMLGATALSVAYAPAVLAADIASKPIYTKAPMVAESSWTGWYAGLNAGYGSGRANTFMTTNAAEAVFVGPLPLAPNPLPGTLKPNGFVGGGQLGYNRQFGNMVAGLETDLSFAGLQKTDAATGPFTIGGSLTTTIESKLNWFGKLRARFGILPTNDLLIFGTGGLAYGGVQTTTTASNIGPTNCITNLYCGSGSTSGVSVGWTAGGGLEYAIARQWTIKAEYLYLDLGSRSVTFADRDIPGGTLTANTSFKAQIARAGFNYRF